MTFVKRTDWVDEPNEATPIMAADLLRIEQGIADAQNPTLAPVATSGDYADLSGRPSLATVATSGSYTDLTSKPTIPTQYTDANAVSALQNAANVLPSGQWNFTLTPEVNGVPISGGGGTVADATTTSKGVVQLAGDLGGTAAAPTVPNKLNAKNSSTNISAPATDYWQHVEILDDGSSTTSWPNRFEAAFTPSGGSRGRTTYLNEYGELRVEPAKSNTVPVRIYNKHAAADPAHSVNAVEIMDDPTTRTLLLSIDASGNLKAPNLPNKLTVSSTAPSSPATNDLWVDLSA